MVVILDFRNVIARGSEEDLARHEKYASTLNSEYDRKPSTLVIISSSASRTFSKPGSKSLFLQATDTKKWNILGYAYHVWKLLRDQPINSKILVAGDPWESTIAALLVKTLLREGTPIQVQVHGDIGDENWIRQSFVNRLRKFLARFTLHAATEIRATTLIQSENLARVYRVKPRKIVVIPVQLNFPITSKINQQKNNILSIGILGRIHKDRGLEKALEIIDEIRKSVPEVSVEVAGDGPDLAWFKGQLESICASQKVKFLGFLGEEKLELFWANCGVFLSTAPAESYGRAMRESIVRRIPVLATVSTGSIELSSETRGGGIVLIEDTDSPREVRQKYELARKMQISDEVISEIMGRNAVIPLKLAQSWIRLASQGS